MARYRKKPVDVEMIQWLGPIEPIENWIDELMARGETVPSGGDFQAAAEPGKMRFQCAASQAQVTIEVGDWIAIERDGRGFYPISRADQADSYVKPGSDPIATVRTALEAIGEAYRGDWSLFDGRTLRSQLEVIARALDEPMQIEELCDRIGVCGEHKCWPEHCPPHGVHPEAEVGSPA